MAGSRRITVEILGDASGLGRAFGAAESSAGKLDSAFSTVEKKLKAVGAEADTSGTKAQQMAAALVEAAADIEGKLVAMEADFAAARSAADAMSNALGPDMVAKLEQGKGGVDGLIAKLNSAGLTYDEIRADADALADAVKRVDQVSMDSARGEADRLGASVDEARADVDQLETSLRQVDDVPLAKARGELTNLSSEADRSKGVMANFAGNASQDMGQLAGVTGSAGVAMGQFAEYATEGDIKLKGLLEALGPMLAITAALEVFKKRMGEAAKADAFNVERVQAYADEIRDGATALEAFKTVAGETREIMVQFPSSLFGSGLVDITPLLADLNIHVDTFATLVGGSRDEVIEWSHKMKDAGADADAVNKIVIAVVQEQGRLTDALDGNAIAMEVFGTTAESEMRKAAEAFTTAEHDNRKLTEAIAADQIATQNATSAANAHFDALGKLNVQYDTLKGAVDDAKSATQLLDEQYSKLTGKWLEKDAWLSVLDSLDQFKWKMNSGELSTRESKQALIDIQLELADYVTALEGVPAEKKSEILALINRGAIDEAEAALAQLARERIARLFIDVSGVSSGARAFAPGGARADGGSVRPFHDYLVGERGPEILRMGASGGTVIPNHAIGGTTIYNVVVQSLDPKAAAPLVAEALRVHERRNGPVFSGRS